MSSRRSLRAGSKPNTSSQPQSHSSTSSSSSGRPDRSARSHQKPSSPRSSVAPRSLSSEEAEGSTKRSSRRTRSQDDTKIEVVERIEDEGDEEDEEEITRCVCGNLEYPGLPLLPSSSKGANKPNGVGDPAGVLQEDTGGLFIQCDICKVWQHGGCVGIMDEAMCPDEYFCEQCRKNLHRVTTSVTGQRYSRYLPVQETGSSKSSPTPIVQDSKKSKERTSRANAEILAGKRRSTMNSRDSAYDEAEQLRRAIEESKKEAVSTAEGGTRRRKRSRSDSEERKEDSKRQRTTSRPSSSRSESKTSLPNAESADEGDNTAKPEGPNRIRGAAARNHRAKELREREERREQEKADAAGRRKVRSERRRGEGKHINLPKGITSIDSSSIDSDPSEEPLSRTTSKQRPDTLAPTSPTVPKASHKKTGRPPARRGKVGRNQYTRDRDPPAETNTSPARSNSAGAADENGTPHINGTHSPHIKTGKEAAEGGGSKPSRLKHLNPSKTTMTDMKRRVAAILDFISHTQVEMAAHSDIGNPQSSSNPTPPDSGSSGGGGGGGKEWNGSTTATTTLQRLLEGQGKLEDEDGEAFAKLSSVEMMEVLTRRLMRWQGEYGK